MAYEQRLSIAKFCASGILLANVALSMEGFFDAPDSAGRAVLIFSIVVLVLGLVLIWHHLYATGRGVRMAMFLVMGISVTSILTTGVSVLDGGVFVAAMLIALLSIKFKEDTPRY